MCHFASGFICREHPLDVRTRIISLLFPGGDFGFQPLAIGNAAVKTLGVQHADFDLHHVQPSD
jgi:hypothetical protein